MTAITPETLVERTAHLPGADLVLDGLRDLGLGRETDAALLVLIGAPRLRQLGFEVPTLRLDLPEDRLYERLAREHGDAAHSKYNSLIRRLVSFERAAACVGP